ncbi:MAG: hypothetical protein EXX96DRAFT_588728 [Benjaminiella poitrasii]|nr:MAG: hypothetical protein EXX96DRAFT_588728 [Benjaminiella poitrasii]
MDDLLDLNWSAPSSTVKQSIPKEKPEDAFADLLSTPSKPADISKLSLIEQQLLKQQQQQNSESPWLTPIQASPLPKASALPKDNTSTYTPSPTASFSENNKQKPPTSSLSFDNLLDPFGTNTEKKQDQNRNTPLNQLRTQQVNTAADEQQQQQWDFDFLDSKLNSSATTSSSPSDPFEVNSHVQQSNASPLSQSMINENYEDDNPLGLLAQPVSMAPPVREENVSPTLPSSPQLPQTQTQLDEDEEDSMLAQLIEMGFSLQESKFAVEATAGQSLQVALDLLTQNNVEKVQRHQSAALRQTSRQASTSRTERAQRALFQSTDGPSAGHESSSDVFQPEKIMMQAQELGGFLYKNATSYFKASRDKVTKAVEDWQEQQRTHRLQHMQEEQNGTVRPKWMAGHDEDMMTTISSNTKMEKFVDDDDDDDDLETERRRVEELRRRQAEKQLQQKQQQQQQQRQRQQQPRKEKLLLDDEDQVYVSPSRRRGLQSGKSTSRSPVTPQQPSPVNVRTRPTVKVSPDIMAQVNKSRNLGNEKFKLGQFGEAEEAYSHAINILPEGHDHLVLLCNNRAAARLKIGHYKQCIEDCDRAIALAKENDDGQTESEGVVIQWRDQAVKSLYRKAEALESMEKYKEALATYDALVKYEGTNNHKVNQGMSRCREALNPKKNTKPPSNESSQKKGDFMSMFDPTTNSTTNATPSTPVSYDELGKSKAVAAMRAKAAQQEIEDAEKLEKTDEVNARLLAWKVGKEQNLRALLATLDTLLWPGAQWKGAQMSELINPKKCKMTYMKAIGKVHPDKVDRNIIIIIFMIALPKRTKKGERSNHNRMHL